MNIIPVIRDLLLRNQKAVIPGFGSFMVVQRPAQLNKVTQVLTPPAMVVRFDKNQQTNDGRLSDYLVQKLKQEPKVAEEAIKNFVSVIVSQLTNSGSAELEGMGSLKNQKSGEIEFAPADELLKRISLFDLPNISVPVTPVDKTTPTFVVSRDIPVVRRKSAWWIPVTLLLIAVGLLAAVKLTGNLDELVSDIKALVGIEKEPVTERLVFGNSVEEGGDSVTNDTLLAQISRELDEQMDREKALAYKESGSTTAIKEETDQPKTAQIATVGINKPYHIIAGAFREPENAEKQKAALQQQGYSPAILPRQRNFYMVSLGSYDTDEQATSAMKQFSTKIDIELWVLKR